MNATWGYNNRGVAVRVPVSGASDRRLEHRVAGADANPYLVAATVLAGMLHGIERKLAPPAPLTGNAYTQRLTAPRLPADWPTALTRFGASPFLDEYFGERFVTLYELTRRGDAFDSEVEREDRLFGVAGTVLDGAADEAGFGGEADGLRGLPGVSGEAALQVTRNGEVSARRDEPAVLDGLFARHLAVALAEGTGGGTAGGGEGWPGRVG